MNLEGVSQFAEGSTYSKFYHQKYMKFFPFLRKVGGKNITLLDVQKPQYDRLSSTRRETP
jgi:hypothetical protein